MDQLEPTLLIVPLLAVLAPLLARGLRPLGARPDRRVRAAARHPRRSERCSAGRMPHAFIETLSQFGLAMLFFVAGSEIEFAAFRGRTGRSGDLRLAHQPRPSASASAGSSHPARSAIVIGIALCSTALGTILPILRDAGELRHAVRQAVGAVGAVGEFGPLIAISIFLGGEQPGHLGDRARAVRRWSRGSRSGWRSRCRAARCTAFVNSTLHTSGQFAIRVVFLILAALVALSIVLDLDMLLGAFAAGIVWRLIMRDAQAGRPRGGREQGRGGRLRVPRAGLLHLHRGDVRPRRAARADPILFLLLPARARRALRRARACRRRSPHRGLHRPGAPLYGALRRDRPADHRRGHRDRRRRGDPPTAERGAARRRGHALGAAVPAHRDDHPRRAQVRVGAPVEDDLA